MAFTTTFQGPTQTVVLTRAPSVDLTHGFERLNHISKRLTSGEQFTVDIGPTLLVGRLIFKFVNGTEKRLLEQLIVNDLKFTLFPLTITPPACVDLGLDDGQAVTCKLNNVKSTTDIFTKANVVDRWDISIPYELVVADSVVGVGVDGVA